MHKAGHAHKAKNEFGVVPGEAVAKLFAQTVNQVAHSINEVNKLPAAQNANKIAAHPVDIEIAFQNVQIDKSGFLKSLFNNSSKQSSVSVRLATRITPD